MPRSPYVLKPEDSEIIEKSRSDGRYFTGYYLRTRDQAEGWLFDRNLEHPWQLEFHHTPHTDLCVVGGFGSSKTAGVAMSALVWSALTPDFKFLDVAPTTKQSFQMFDFLRTELYDTLFQERFVWKMVERPYPRIDLRYRLPNGRTVSSTMEFMSAADDAVRIKNYEGDWVNLDQAEMMENLLEAVENLGTRVRGSVKGRTRMGRLSILANSEDNPELWYIFDMAETYPETNWSRLISTYDNKNLTESQIQSFERRLGGSARKIAQKLRGERPMGKGEEFNRELIEGCVDEALDRQMEHHLKLETPGYAMVSTHEAGVVLWQMPPEKGATYLVVGDPGQGKPPYRNAPVVMVFDISHYPDSPLALRAMWWGDGGGKYEPWTTQFLLWMDAFHALGGGYDSTGGQKVHSEFSFSNYSNIWPIDMAGAKKGGYMVTLKLVMMRQGLKMPRGIKGLLYQLSKYKTPDKKLPQDLVATLFILSGCLWAMGLTTPELEEEESEKADAPPPPVDRYSRRRLERHARAGSRR